MRWRFSVLSSLFCLATSHSPFAQPSTNEEWWTAGFLCENDSAQLQAKPEGSSTVQTDLYLASRAEASL
jgi:hypothetical protein